MIWKVRPNESLSSSNDWFVVFLLKICLYHLANMTLPKADSGVFDSIEYAYLSEPEAQKLVEEYRIEGADTRLQIIINRRRKAEKSVLNEQTMPQLPGAGLKSTTGFRSNYGIGSSSSSSLSSSISSSSSFGFKRDLNYKYNRFNNPNQSKRMFTVNQHVYKLSSSNWIFL